MGGQEFRNGFGNAQFPNYMAVAGAPEGGSESQRVILTQNSALNVFVMGPGNVTINLGFHVDAAAAQGRMASQMWNNVGITTHPQQEQFQPPSSFGATSTGTTFPQSGSISELRNSRLSPGATIHPSKLGTTPQEYGSAVNMRKRLSVSALSPISHSPPNGNSPQDLIRKSPDSGYNSPSQAEIIPPCNSINFPADVRVGFPSSSSSFFPLTTGFGPINYFLISHSTFLSNYNSLGYLFHHFTLL
ncbi:hypothetical protein Ocin01_14278 [Orchesella cincta]|uniref:Uncharacterized protein n=1 Tax=Orchesella cincta TaxID=48709 RepID=A0A1D2MHK2_ORCCI|nr:hypothetical protein Ocin01_14278 [Orchesella cincta]